MRDRVVVMESVLGFSRRSGQLMMLPGVLGDFVAFFERCKGTLWLAWFVVCCGVVEDS